MNAKEIRNNSSSFVGFWTREIAAQLAELNESLRFEKSNPHYLEEMAARIKELAERANAIQVDSRGYLIVVNPPEVKEPAVVKKIDFENNLIVFPSEKIPTLGICNLLREELHQESPLCRNWRCSTPSVSEQSQAELEPLPGSKHWTGTGIGPVLKHSQE